MKDPVIAAGKLLLLFMEHKSAFVLVISTMLDVTLTDVYKPPAGDGDLLSIMDQMVATL